MARFAQMRRKEAEDCRGICKVLIAAEKDACDITISIGIDGQYMTIPIAGGNATTQDFIYTLIGFFTLYGNELVAVASVADAAADPLAIKTEAVIAPEGP